MPEEFWLNDAQWARWAPLLPNKSRGVPQVDDCRVISGIVHVVKSRGRWVVAPASYGSRETLYNRFVRWAAKGVWTDLFHTLAAAGGPLAVVLLDSSAVNAHRCASGGKGGERSAAVGRSRAGRSTKVHALTDGIGRPLSFLLSGGSITCPRASWSMPTKATIRTVAAT